MLEAKGGNMTMVKYQNRALILSVIKNKGPVSRVDIAQMLQLTPAAITILVNDMVKEGMIKEVGPQEQDDKRSGRKKVLIDINYDYKYVIGINIEPGLVSIGVSNIKGDVIVKRKIGMEEATQPVDLLKQISSECMNILWKENILKDKILGIGVGIVGPVDRQNGISKHAYGLWKTEVNIKEILEKEMGTKVVVDNNVRTLALGEIDYHGSEDMSNILFIKYGPGVGSAIIIDNELYYGSDNSSGEIGHTFVNYVGEVCKCGRKGCLETVVSQNAIIEKVKSVFDENSTPVLYKLCGGDKSLLSFDIICNAAQDGDAGILKVMRNALFYMAVAITNAVSLFDPHKVVLYGEPLKHTVVISELNNLLKEYMIGKEIDKFVSVSELSYRSNYIGATALALREFFYNTGGM